MELPLLVFPVGEGDPLVAGDDAVVDGEDGLGVHPDPGHLHSTVWPAGWGGSSADPSQHNTTRR